MSEADWPLWEYKWFFSTGDDALNEMMRKANALGEQRWEMVNFAVDAVKPFTAVCFFKRPRLPGVTPEPPEEPEPPRRFL
ncbi:MAG: hypothetical protein WAN71_06795 [Mycobacterium sp.]|uniref:hypothetical protein n=1 Tax=Mycobacterium sp. TaxID=1785 RepID=UPI003BAEF0CE